MPKYIVSDRDIESLVFDIVNATRCLPPGRFDYADARSIIRDWLASTQDTAEATTRQSKLASMIVRDVSEVVDYMAFGRTYGHSDATHVIKQWLEERPT